LLIIALHIVVVVFVIIVSLFFCECIR